MESGRCDRHLRRVRTEYAARRAAPVAALAEHAPQARVCGLVAGCHAVLDLPQPAGQTAADLEAAIIETAVIETASRRGVGLYGMAPLRSSAAGPPQLVLGFGDTGRRAIGAGIAAVADLLRPR